MKKRRYLSRTYRFSKKIPPKQTDTPELATKRIILEISGDTTSPPASLRNSLLLRDNLQFRDDEFTILQIRLNNYVQSKNKQASIGSSETQDCESVGDCVTMVEGKVSV